MSHYVIGDVQGCYDELINLCSKIKFNPKKDTLIFAGDLINRGPKSLEVLNFCLENKKSIKAVLGNHDFYLLYLIEHKKNNRSLKIILNANNISNYFSGVLLLNESKYEESHNFLRKLDGLENSHNTYSSKYLYSLVNSGHFNKAFAYSKKLDKKQKGSFESDLIIIVSR